MIAGLIALRLLVADAEPLGDAGAHVVVDDVGAGDQPAGDLLAPRVLQVEGQRLLAVARPDVDGVGQVELARRDLDHRGAEVGEHLRRRTGRRWPGRSRARATPASGASGDGRCSVAAGRGAQPAATSATSTVVAARGRIGGLATPSKPCDVADLADRAELGVVELDDHALALPAARRAAPPPATGSAAARSSPRRRGAPTRRAAGWRSPRRSRRTPRPGPARSSRSRRTAMHRPVRRGRRVDAGRVGPQERVLERRPLVQPARRRRPGRCPSAPAGRSTTGGSSGASWRRAASPSRSC